MSIYFERYITIFKWFSEERQRLSTGVTAGLGCCKSCLKFTKKKQSPVKQSFSCGWSGLLAKGLAWQHHSSTRAPQFSCGRGSSRRSFLVERGKQCFTGQNGTVTFSQLDQHKGWKKLINHITCSVIFAPDGTSNIYSLQTMLKTQGGIKQIKTVLGWT